MDFYVAPSAKLLCLSMLPLLILAAVAAAGAQDPSERLQAIRSQLFSDNGTPALSVDPAGYNIEDGQELDLLKKEDEVLAKLRLARANLAENAGQGRLIEPQVQIDGAFSTQRLSLPERVQLGMTKGATEAQEKKLNDLGQTLDKMKASLKDIAGAVKPAGRTAPLKLSKNKTAPVAAAKFASKATDGLKPRNKNTKSETKLEPGAVANRYVSRQNPLAVINVDEADLWSGPSEDDKLLMLLPRNAKVAIELRVDEWYRVITAQGVRAWLHGSVIAFGPDPYSGPNRFIRIHGYDSSAG